MALCNKCCCCCQLRTGVTLVGWIGLMIEIAKVALATVSLIKKEDVAFSKLSEAVGPVDLDVWLPLQMTIAVLGLISYIGLLGGAIGGNRFLLLPWLFIGAMQILCYFVLYLALTVAALKEDTALGVACLVGGLVAVGFTGYIWLCVLSLFQELRDTPTYITPQIPVHTFTVTHQVPYPVVQPPTYTTHTSESQSPSSATEMATVVK